MPTDVPGSPGPPHELALKLIDEERNAGRIEVNRDSLGNFRLMIRQRECSDMELPLKSDEVRMWMRALLWKNGKVYLNNRTLNGCLDIIAGHVLFNPQKPPTDLDTLRFLENEPVAPLLQRLIDVKDRSKTTYTATGLWNALRELDKKQPKRQKQNVFPGSPNVLIRKLRQLKPGFAALGIDIEFKRSNGSKVTLTLTDDSILPSSSNRPDSNSGNDNALQPMDDPDEVLNILRQRMMPDPNTTDKG